MLIRVSFRLTDRFACVFQTDKQGVKYLRKCTSSFKCHFVHFLVLVILKLSI